MKLKKLLNYHYQLFPESRIEDFYKLIYQAVMGPKHLIHNKKGAFYSLEQEVKKLSFFLESPSEKMMPLYFDISLNIPLVRLNLLPYIKESGRRKTKSEKVEKLFFYLVKTAEEIIPEKEKLVKKWQEVENLVRDREVEIGLSEYQEFTEKIIQDNFPAISHSIIYKEKYHPHYRVIKKDFLSVGRLTESVN